MAVPWVCMYVCVEFVYDGVNALGGVLAHSFGGKCGAENK